MFKNFEIKVSMLITQSCVHYSIFQRQVYVGDLTEEVVSCPEDVFKHMFRGESKLKTVKPVVKESTINVL